MMDVTEAPLGHGVVNWWSQYKLHETIKKLTPELDLKVQKEDKQRHPEVPQHVKLAPGQTASPHLM